MKVWELGETGLIELLAEVVGRSQGRSRPNLEIGIGDDAAAWRTEAGTTLATTDTLVENVHFTLPTLPWRDLGWKALAVSVSDIAAMGGTPQYALISLGLPLETEVQAVQELYRGLVAVANRFGVTIAGGNVTRAPVVMINTTVLGRRGPGVLTRRSASPGEAIAVTGYVGTAAGGLALDARGLQCDESTAALLREAHHHPYPRVAEGQLLVREGVRAAIDLSDGLVRDLTHLCRESGVAARLWLSRLPIHPMLKVAFPQEYLDMALSGGEDYELLFTATTETVGRVKRLAKLPVTVIGEVVDGEPGKATLLDTEGRVVEREQAGWDHFRANATESPRASSW